MEEGFSVAGNTGNKKPPLLAQQRVGICGYLHLGGEANFKRRLTPGRLGACSHPRQGRIPAFTKPNSTLSPSPRFILCYIFPILRNWGERGPTHLFGGKSSPIKLPQFPKGFFFLISLCISLSSSL